ncbi:hypothetical protein P153DRAFT_308652 [Dothidotthia symphoricarpi CBS 119687]|uniref:VPS9 domain-containing protein n=1 Tax=Dothidotthia symphoricarpi CBS 119687 TaxID=1392245 RepID=A0A6A6AP88_9PLEO|nr:uncharacterized protein P153DRAFT_308652 [Dothidotthia symphoricarpi CBS 119687]KAF2133610.1 hypothetical protein P153DRAFT_308652 [Dothidotthia symphoricarpi CBS 119687]
MSKPRPGNLHTSRSFTRLDSTPKTSLAPRNRANTLQGPNAPNMLDPLKTDVVHEEDESVDVFSKKEDEEQQPAVPDAFEELPIEIRSLTERFLESLSAKVHPSPLSADALSDLFQDFYIRASSKINTHIATLSARLTSEAFVSNKGSAPSSKPGSIRAGVDHSAEQQMLSATEMSDRKKARKSLEAKRFALEEAVERAVCEKVYQRIWRHRSTDDEERDHKLRSRTAALSLVGIGLKELLMTGEELTEEERRKAKEKEPEIREWLSTARQDILKMNDEKHPLGKVQHLTAAHKSIVEALSKIFPATSSADEILPTLIYALITMPPIYLNVISDLQFIQRFRGSSRMDGETAYCLVNLEAAISFLETVDLSSLRAEEPTTRDRSNSRPSTPKTEITPMALGLAQAPDLVQIPATPTSPTVAREPSSPTTTKAQRRLSNLIQTHTNRIEAASDAVRDSILDSADQALGRINTTLDTSFKFFFGGPRERNPNGPIPERPELPKTLEDAMKLVGSPTRLTHDDDMLSISAASSVQGDDRPEMPGNKDLGAKMTDLFAGRRQIRDRSVDSTRSGTSNAGSGRRVTLPPTTVEEKAPSPVPTKFEPPAPSPSALDSVRNMGNSLNPLNRFASINVLPRFGRALSSTSTPVLPSPTVESKASFFPEPLSRTGTGDVTAVDDKGAKALAALEQLKKTTPPMKKFMDTKDAQELKLKEVDELLKDYQRLAVAMRGAINH